MTAARDDQVWRLTADGRRHRVEAGGGVRRRVEWWVDDVLVARARSAEDRLVLRPGAGLGDDGLPDAGGAGTIAVRFSALGAPRRATLFGPGEAAGVRSQAGVGGTDLVPDPGTPAAGYEARVRAHPGRYTALQVAGGVAKVVLPLLLGLLVVRLAVALPFPDLPWPDLPRVPVPDLPAPDLPAVPWPDWSLPGWVREVLSYAKYAWPVVLAFVLARAELKRRQRQDELRARQAAGPGTGPGEQAEDRAGD